MVVRFSPDEKKLMSFSMDYTVRIWDARTGTLLQRFRSQAWDKMAAPFRYPVFNGEKIALVWPDTIEVWNVTFESQIQKMWRNDIVMVTLSPNEQKFASGSSNGSIGVWDIPSGMLLQTYEGYAGEVMSLEYSPNGQKLASKLRKRNQVLLWDLGTTSLLHTLNSQVGQYDTEINTPLAFSRSGKIIACGFAVGTVEIWDAVSGAALQTLKGFGHRVIGIALSLNEKYLASCDSLGTVQVWYVPTGSLSRTLFQLNDKRYDSAAAFSLTGQRFSSGNNFGDVKVWEIAFSSPLSQKLQGHDDGIQNLVFSSDGQKLASLCNSSIVCLWDVATGSPRKLFSKARVFWYNSCISSVAFSADGTKLVSLESKNIFDIWDIRHEQLLNWKNPSLIELHAATANSPYGLSLIDRWITVNQKRIIRVPPNRHGSAFATYGTKVAIGSSSGAVTLLDLDLELMESSIASPPTFQQDIFVSPSDVYNSDSASEDDDDSSSIEYLGQRECR